MRHRHTRRKRAHTNTERERQSNKWNKKNKCENIRVPISIYCHLRRRRVIFNVLISQEWKWSGKLWNVAKKVAKTIPNTLSFVDSTWFLYIFLYLMSLKLPKMGMTIFEFIYCWFTISNANCQSKFLKITHGFSFNCTKTWEKFEDFQLTSMRQTFVHHLIGRSLDE